ncbi:conserved hypothetical protein [delta proteobacterium NaphS2]|nr:conserved hypothetical protein [delta proteobacterium NaphS2]
MKPEVLISGTYLLLGAHFLGQLSNFSLNKTLKTILSDTPLVKNLENKEYLDIILDGCNTLEQRFARVDSKLVLQELDKKRKETGRLPQILKKMIREPAFPRKLGELFGC